eukprot:1189420-Prorocentrum_minimum.AAC.3
MFARNEVALEVVCHQPRQQTGHGPLYLRVVCPLASAGLERELGVDRRVGGSAGLQVGGCYSGSAGLRVVHPLASAGLERELGVGRRSLKTNHRRGGSIYPT